jgi:hypothetical protein
LNPLSLNTSQYWSILILVSHSFIEIGKGTAEGLFSAIKIINNRQKEIKIPADDGAEIEMGVGE